MFTCCQNIEFGFRLRSFSLRATQFEFHCVLQLFSSFLLWFHFQTPFMLHPPPGLFLFFKLAQLLVIILRSKTIL